jgi:hypothetical protein
MPQKVVDLKVHFGISGERRKNFGCLVYDDGSKIGEGAKIATNCFKRRSFIMVMKAMF